MLRTALLPKLLTILLGTIILLFVAFYNGYPLVYSDTGTYIQSGFELFVPVDRPLTYGLFLRYTSLGFSPWLSVCWQAFFLAFALFYLFRLLFPLTARAQQCYWLSLFILVSCTGMGWTVALLMPDIFMSIGMISLCLLLFDPTASPRRMTAYSLLLLLSGSVHFSHLLIMSLLLLSLSLYDRWRVKRAIASLFKRKRMILAWTLNIVAWLAVPSLHYAVEGKFQASKASHVFLMGRLLDMGLLQKVLDDHCATENYQLCAYKDQLPADSRKLHWDAESPIYKAGGWEATREEYNRILWKSVSRPQYWVKHIFEAGKSTAIQLSQIGIGNDLKTDWYGQPASPPYQQIAKRFPGEFKQYQQSRQNTNLWKQSLDFDRLNTVFTALLWLSVLWLILIFTSHFRRYISPLQWQLFIVFVLAIFFNAAVTANLSVVAERFQSRIIWTFPLLVLMLMAGNFSHWRSLFQLPENKNK